LTKACAGAPVDGGVHLQKTNHATQGTHQASGLRILVAVGFASQLKQNGNSTGSIEIVIHGFGKSQSGALSPINLDVGGRNVLKGLVQTVQSLLSIAQIIWCVVLQAAVMVAHNKEAQHFSFTRVGD